MMNGQQVDASYSPPNTYYNSPPAPIYNPSPSAPVYRPPSPVYHPPTVPSASDYENYNGIISNYT